MRLADAITVEKGWFGSFVWAKKPVRGRLTDSSLFIRKTIGYNNSEQTYLKADISSEGSGTVISGRFGVHPIARWSGILWVSFVIVGCVAFSVDFFFGKDTDIGWFVLIPWGMLLFYFLLIRFCRYLARDEDRFLADFLIRTLDATERRSTVRGS